MSGRATLLSGEFYPLRVKRCRAYPPTSAGDMEDPGMAAFDEKPLPVAKASVPIKRNRQAWTGQLILDTVSASIWNETKPIIDQAI